MNFYKGARYLDNIDVGSNSIFFHVGSVLQLANVSSEKRLRYNNNK